MPLHHYTMNLRVNVIRKLCLMAVMNYPKEGTQVVCLILQSWLNMHELFTVSSDNQRNLLYIDISSAAAQTLNLLDHTP